MLDLTLFSVIAASRPEVVLSRTDAKAMSAQALRDSVLVDFPHEEITRVTVIEPATGPDGNVHDPSLSYISFTERAHAGDGRLCQLRTIGAVFGWLDGGLGKPLTERSADDPKRFFHVGARPKIAVLPHKSSDTECSALPLDRFAALNPAPEHKRRLEQFLGLTEAYEDGDRSTLDIDCEDWRAVEAKECRAEEALAKIDWADLFSITGMDWPHGTPATRLTFMQSDRSSVHVFLSGDKTNEAARLVYAWPAPF